MTRFNPFSEALANRMSGIEGVLKQTPPPAHIQEAIEDYNRRMSDPDSTLPEWRAIVEQHGALGIVEYIEDMNRIKDAWGL